MPGQGQFRTLAGRIGLAQARVPCVKVNVLLGISAQASTERSRRGAG
jgi:hypothetical protein